MVSYSITVQKTPVVYSGFCFECNGIVKGKLRSVAVISYSTDSPSRMAIPICRDCSEAGEIPDNVAEIDPDYQPDTDVPELVAVVNE